jgi:hypothetical protein
VESNKASRKIEFEARTRKILNEKVLNSQSIDRVKRKLIDWYFQFSNVWFLPTTAGNASEKSDKPQTTNHNSLWMDRHCLELFEKTETSWFAYKHSFFD